MWLIMQKCIAIVRTNVYNLFNERKCYSQTIAKRFR